MFFNTLAVIVVSLIISLFLSTTLIHGYPSSSSHSSSADLSSSLRLFKHRPVPSVDNDLVGDISEMFIGDTNEDDDSLEALQKRLSIRQLNLHSLADSSSSNLDSTNNNNNQNNLEQLNEPIRLSPSLKTLVETNPFARAWLTMLLQKLMQEKHVPYIFKYGRR